MSDIEKRIEQWRAGLVGSELLGGSDVTELESHLREEMEHLKSLRLSDEEAFFIARRRLGDSAALEEEFAKVNPSRRISNRLYWMIMGVMGYYVLLPVSGLLPTASAYLAYRIGLASAWVTSLIYITGMIAYAAVVYRLLRYLASRWHSQIIARRLAAPICLVVLAALANLLLCWGLELVRHHIWTGVTQSMGNQMAATLSPPMASIAWYATMTFLLGGALVIFGRRSRERA